MTKGSHSNIHRVSKSPGRVKALQEKSKDNFKSQPVRGNVSRMSRGKDWSPEPEGGADTPL